MVLKMTPLKVQSMQAPDDNCQTSFDGNVAAGNLIQSPASWGASTVRV